MTYKDEQKATRQALKLSPKMVHTGPTLNLGIRKFKESNPGQSDSHKIYKENSWLNPIGKPLAGSSRDNRIGKPEPKPKTIYPSTVTTNHERMLYRKQLRINHEPNNL